MQENVPGSAPKVTLFGCEQRQPTCTSMRVCVCCVSRSGWCPWPCKAGLSGVIYAARSFAAGLAASFSSPGFCKSPQLPAFVVVHVLLFLLCRNGTFSLILTDILGKLGKIRSILLRNISQSSLVSTFCCFIISDKCSSSAFWVEKILNLSF